MCRAFEEESKARMGVVECVTHKLLDPFDVLYDKEGIIYVNYCLYVLFLVIVYYNVIMCLWVGEFVAQFKFTVLLMPNGPLR